MYFTKLIVSGLMAAGAMAHVAREAGALSRCVAPEATQEELDRAFRMDVEAAEYDATAVLNVDLAFHVVASGKTFSQGWLSVCRDPARIANTYGALWHGPLTDSR
jgi:hypothetical protein